MKNVKNVKTFLDSIIHGEIDNKYDAEKEYLKKKSKKIKTF